MSKLTNALHAWVAACSVLMAACQPAEGPAERAGRNVDNAAQQFGEQVDKASEKSKNAVNDAKQ